MKKIIEKILNYWGIINNSIFFALAGIEPDQKKNNHMIIFFLVWFVFIPKFF